MVAQDKSFNATVRIIKETIVGSHAKLIPRSILKSLIVKHHDGRAPSAKQSFTIKIQKAFL